ncbi:hypothetical protein [Roseovarius mucosus]|uniref:hypothetical protein n=1 Tax=Roseovarius mucosus TaxID=215743 RepID=UPI003BACBA02
MPKKFEDAVSAVLSGADPDQVAETILAETKPAEPEVKAPKIGEVIAQLVMDATMSYDQIVTLIHDQFKPCNTSARSVASVAARLRRDGVEVPHRRKAKAVAE